MTNPTPNTATVSVAEVKVLNGLMTERTVMRLFDVSRATLQRLRKRGAIRFVRLAGRGIRYRTEDILEFMNGR